MNVRKYFEDLPNTYGLIDIQEESVSAVTSLLRSNVTDAPSVKPATVGVPDGSVTLLRVVHAPKEYPEFKKLAKDALEYSEIIVEHWLPGGYSRYKEYKALNPLRADRYIGSFSINLDTGRWADFATQHKGGDLISLVAYLEQCSQGEAAKLLEKFLEELTQPARI